MSKKNPDNLVWIDLEMTGLDPDKERIIEIATIVTDPFLNVLAEGPVLAVHQPDALLAQMDEWNTSHHGQSGLVERVRASQHSTQDAEKQTIAFLADYVDAGQSPICGNSIGQDRRFLRRYMPKLDDFFHYRSLDVSTLKELVRRWRPEVAAGLVKKGSHLALDDVRESIAELAYYREHFLNVDVD